MSQKAFQKKIEARSERWAESLKELARERGDTESVGLRAVELSRQLNISPWIALGLAEGRITMKDAQLFDRVGRCKELQSAILDKHRTVEELRGMMPYAAHFLAVELLDFKKNAGWDVRVLTRILEGILGAEKRTGEGDISFAVRLRPVEEYAASVERVMAIMRRVRCNVNMALDVDTGRMTEEFAVAYVKQKRNLEMEERQQMAPPGFDDRPHFPRRRGDLEPAGRRPAFQGGEGPRPSTPSARDHWPRNSEAPAARDHWPKS